MYKLHNSKFIMKKTLFLLSLLAVCSGAASATVFTDSLLDWEDPLGDGLLDTANFGNLNPFGDASDGEIDVMSGLFDYSGIYGGWGGDGFANSNSVLMVGGSVNRVLGGYAENGEASYNEVIFRKDDDTDAPETGAIWGGYSLTGVANQNRVYFMDGIANSSIVGGDGLTGASENKVSILGGSTWTVFGANSSDGEANKNSVDIVNATADYLKGGFGTNASENRVSVIESMVEHSIVGGAAHTDTSAGNFVSVSNSTAKREIMGGHGYQVKGNSVDIYGSTCLSSIYGGGGMTSATGNSVTITDSTCSSIIYGGEALATLADENSVLLVNSSAESVIGGSGVTSANGNTVTIAGGTINGRVAGGVSDTSATDNTVNLVGKGAEGNFGSGSTISGNTITIGGMLCGGTGENTTSTGNTVNIIGSDIHADLLDVGSIQALNFSLGTSEETMLSVNQEVDFAETAMPVNIDFNCTAATMKWLDAFSTEEGKAITLVNLTENTADAVFTFDGISAGNNYHFRVLGMDYNAAFVGLVGEVHAGQIGLVMDSAALQLVGKGITGTPVVPEPATGTLSLLALAGLAARRKRK